MLAMLLDEPGAERVEGLVADGVVSTVNWAEVVQKSRNLGASTTGLAEELVGAGLAIVPFDLDDAELAATLWERTHHLGLSLADRACLATALRRSGSVITADRAWSELDIGISIEVIR